MKQLFLIAAACGIAGAVMAQGAKPKAAAKPKSATAPAGKIVYKKTAKGLEYNIVRDEAGVTARVSDYIEMNIRSRVGDSVMFDSRKMNNNQPVSYQVPPAQYNGDLSEGFTLLSAGDSALFRVSVDSMIKAGATLPPWLKEGSNMVMDYTVVIVSVKTPEQMRKDMEEHAAKQKDIDDKLIQDYCKKMGVQPMKTASGLYYSIVQKGAGQALAAGDTVSMNYTGKLLDGTPFDSNTDPKFQHVMPFEFMLGRRQVIQGWDEGIALLNQGTKAVLYIPSGLAYRDRGQGPIPANAVLVFDVEVVGVKKAK